MESTPMLAQPGKPFHYDDDYTYTPLTQDPMAPQVLKVAQWAASHWQDLFFAGAALFAASVATTPFSVGVAIGSVIIAISSLCLEGDESFPNLPKSWVTAAAVGTAAFSYIHRLAHQFHEPVAEVFGGVFAGVPSGIIVGLVITARLLRFTTTGCCQPCC